MLLQLGRGCNTAETELVKDQVHYLWMLELGRGRIAAEADKRKQ